MEVKLILVQPSDSHKFYMNVLRKADLIEWLDNQQMFMMEANVCYVNGFFRKKCTPAVIFTILTNKT